ncbi:unnamed protein product [Ceratitis capitata]|uniref:(Mediterranean fruit fly) hypothetical protein n=1 Tax=Ceratitis capitata TaxID=7213 RepID=A0A811UWB5_CERCA|nr:unnamed protein product [Ceratitis capitata]
MEPEILSNTVQQPQGSDYRSKFPQVFDDRDSVLSKYKIYRKASNKLQMQAKHKSAKFENRYMNVHDA